MAAKWHKTKYPGIRYREHPTRKHGVKKDRYFSYRFKVNGKEYNGGLGWASEGWTLEKVNELVGKFKRNARQGNGPTSLAEMREIEEERKKEDEARQRLEKVKKLTFEEFFKDTYLPQAKANKKPNSVRTEEQLFNLWIKPVIGNKPLKKISPLDLECIKKSMRDAKKSPRSIQYALAVIRQVFNLARMLNLYQGDNPVSKVKKPTLDNRRLRFLSRNEADLLFTELKKRSQQLHDIALVSLHCGLRAGEIFNLTWDCIDLDKEQILIKDPKNKNNRYAFMTAEVKEMLQRRYQGQLNGFVFTDRYGNKIKEVSNAFARAVKEVGLNKGIEDRRQKVVFHTLRHTYASWLVERGVDLYTVKELMGHKTLAMTERYSHLGENTLKQAVNRLNETL
ncbi:tyrosine-type recombinase/integrase [Desulfovulcanus sp.]